METELLPMADDIATHPEIGFVEERSVAKLTDYLRKHDFSIEKGIGGLDTAFVAKFRRNNGHPILGVILEYDALRGTKGAFHGDQHSAQGPVGMAAAIAMAEYLDRTHTPGSVVVYGTPGEEMMPPNAKTVMHQSHVVRRRGRDPAEPRLVGHVASSGRLRHVLPEHHRRQVHIHAARRRTR